jgi:hypothetical protein
MATETMGAQALGQVLVGGDLSRLSPEDRILYYTNICESLGLNALTRPLDYITLNGKMTLYAKRDCTDQLRKINGVSIIIVSREVVEDCYIVTARAIDKNKRSDESIGAVPIGSLKGEARSNAMMKAETKAKRRVTLSICGMGILDETEVSNGLESPPLMITSSVEPQEAEVEPAVADHLSEIIYLMSTGKVAEAYNICKSLEKDHKDKVWSLLSVKERELLKNQSKMPSPDDIEEKQHG